LDVADKIILKLNQSLHGLVQAPLCWGNHLRDALVNTHGFTESQKSPCLYFHNGVMILMYVDDCLFFAKDKRQIDTLLESIRSKSNQQFTIEDDAFTFLGVKLKQHKDGTVKFLQKGLIEKVPKHCHMEECNTKSAPANQTPLVSDTDGPAFD
jgi:hypothetical protein